MTILQMHLVRYGIETDEVDHAIDIEEVGLGRILWVPVVVQCMDRTIGNLSTRIRCIVSRSVRRSRRVGEGRLRSILSSLQALADHHGGHLRHRATILSDHLCDLLVTHNVDLLALHWLSYDAGALISRALKARVPFVLINHFDNARLSQPESRKWIAKARAIGGVSDRGIPDDLRNRYINLSDAVDTEFFNPERAKRARLPVHPMIFLPARVEVGKGHRDLMEAARIFLSCNVQCVLCFAGAVESESLEQELRTYAATAQLEKRILFLGEISREELRDWYARSSVIVLPSHSEGLGRVLLEAQAMKKPVVAYDCGGMSDAVLANETGFLVEKGNVEVLAGKIRFLLENEAERARMGENGREFVSRHFSVSALVQRHETFYLRALSGTGAKRNGC